MYGHPPFRHVHYSVFRVTLSIFASSKKLFFEIQILTEHKESLIGLMMDCHHSELMGESSSFGRPGVSVCTGHISSACSASVHHPAVAFIKRAFLPSTCVARSPASSPEWTAFPFPPFLLSSGGQLFDISTPFVSASVSHSLQALLCPVCFPFCFAFPFRNVQVLHFLFCEELSFCAARFNENMRGREIGEWRYAERPHSETIRGGNAAMLMILSESRG